MVLTAVLTSQACGAWLDFVLRRGWPLLAGDDPGAADPRGRCGPLPRRRPGPRTACMRRRLLLPSDRRCTWQSCPTAARRGARRSPPAERTRGGGGGCGAAAPGVGVDAAAALRPGTAGHRGDSRRCAPSSTGPTTSRCAPRCAWRTGELWPIPVTLDLPRTGRRTADARPEGSTLRARGEDVAVLWLRSAWRPDRQSGGGRPSSAPPTRRTPASGCAAAREPPLVRQRSAGGAAGSPRTTRSGRCATRRPRSARILAERGMARGSSPSRPATRCTGPIRS